MRPRRRMAGRKRRRVRVMTGSADLPVDRAELTLPIATRAAVDPGFPVAISGTVAAAAEGGTFDQLYLPPIACLQQFQVCFIMTVEAVVIAMVTASGHYDVLLF